MPLILWLRVLGGALGDILYFPFWWYTGGVKYAGGKIFNLLRFGNATLAPGIWLKNLFVPMYGQHDIQGRIISFVLRLVQIIFRGIMLFLWLTVCVALFIAWLFMPLMAIYGIFFISK